MAFLLLSALLSTTPEVKRAIEQVRALDEEAALVVLQRAKASPENAAADLAEIYLWIGLANAGLAKKDAAREAFQSALLLQPDLKLPLGLSPRVEAWWLEAGGRKPSLTPQPVVVENPQLVTEPVAPAPPPAPSIKWRTWLGVGLLAASAAAAAVGLGFGVRAGELNAQSMAALRVGETMTSFNQASSNASTANWFFAGGGLLVAAGTLLIVF